MEGNCFVGQLYWMGLDGGEKLFEMRMWMEKGLFVPGCIKRSRGGE